ncbi:MAG TPA: TldD/PmbA family protein [Patescibacteria group bacterium]|nr:TldD/PmbA family protein [Patescibacteria group bacterium]
MAGSGIKGMRDDCAFIVEAALDGGAQYADIRLEYNAFTSVELRNLEVDKANVGYNYGAGIRVAANGGWGFSSTNRLDRDSLKARMGEALKLARASSDGLREIKLAKVKVVEDSVPFKGKMDVRDVPLDQKCSDIIEINKNVMAHDERVILSRMTYTDFMKTKVFCSSEGAYIEMDLPEVEVNYNVTSRDKGISQWARSRETGQLGYEFFQHHDIEKLGRNVVEKSIDLLEGEKTPGGVFTVVIDPANVGVFIHEAFGHANEADSVLQRRSFQYGLLETQIASEIVTVISDPTMPYMKGSYPYDEEGTPAKEFTIIEDGILKNYMHTRETAAELGMEPTGNARASDYAVKPIARMNNLYIESGDWKLEEIIEDTKYGLLIEGSRGGMEDPERGGFQLSAQNCYLIEKGEVKHPLRDVAMTGQTLDVLLSIDALADDFYLHPGHCGKGEPGIMQGAGVTDGGPHLRVGNILIGGTR